MLRPWMFKMIDFAGMTATFEFPTPLIVFYGYNRTGKTNPIKAMKWLFKGIKQGMEKGRSLSAIMGDKKEASLEMVFEFKGILYRLRRRLILSKEKEFLSLVSSKVKGSDYLKPRPGIRDEIAFDQGKLEDVITEVEIKQSGDNKNIDLLDEKLKAIGLYPQMIDRLIAIENVQEFRNATKHFSSKDGGGYAVVKDLLSQELKRMETALNHMNQNEGDLAEKLKILDQNIVDEHAGFLQRLYGIVDETKIGNPDLVKAIIDVLSLADAPEKQLEAFRSDLKNLETRVNDSSKKVNTMYNSIPEKREKYNTLEGHVDNLDLELVEAASKEFGVISKSFKDIRDKLLNSITNMESNPPTVAFSAPTFKTAPFKIQGLQEAISRNNLKTISGPDNILKNQTSVTNVVDSFNKARVLFLKLNKLKQKYGVQSESDILQMKQDCESLQLKMKQPVALTASELFPLVGRMEGGKIQVYMRVDQFIPHIEKEAFGVQGILLPLSTKDGEKIPETKIKNIVEMLQKKINELIELKGLIGKKDAELSGLREGLKILDGINNQIDIDALLVKEWDEKVNAAQTLAKAFLKKHLGKNIEGTGFAAIKTALEEVLNRFVAELEAEMGRRYDPEASLSENLSVHEHNLDVESEELSTMLQVLEDVGNAVQNEQESYKNWCKDILAARILHGKMLPTMIAVNEQLLANINIDKIENELVQSIIKYSQAFYQEITGEQYLVIEREGEVGEEIFLKTTLRRPNGPNIDLLDDAASGSEQASIALGIMVALASMFNAFVVIDETTDRFDYPTKLRFFKVIEKYSKDIFTMIVLKVDTNVKNLKEDFDIMRSTFPAAVIYQPQKANDGTMSVAKVNKFEDLKLSDEAS